METKARINWIALSAGFGLALVLAVPLLPATRWIAVASYRQLMGRHDVWNHGPDRIKGDSPDEQLARVLQSPHADRTSLIEKFVHENPERLDARAHLLRYAYFELPGGDKTIDFAVAAKFAAAASDGFKQDRDNLFWPLMEAAFWELADEPELLREAILRGEGAGGYDDHALDEADTVVAELRADNPGLADAEALLVVYAVNFSHMSGLRKVAKSLDGEDVDERVVAARLAAAMSENTDAYIGFLVSISIARTALLPGDPRKSEEIEDSEYVDARDELEATHPDSTDALATALALASMEPFHYEGDYYDFEWDSALEARSARWYLGIALWLGGSLLVIMFGRTLSKIADRPWVTRIAPFVGFLLLMWVFLALQSTVHKSVALWDWHVPEIAIAGFLIGFLALRDKFAGPARWTAVVLTVAILPIAAEVPYVLVPIAVIWISMFLTSKKVSKTPAVVLGALLPCLLTSPIAILVGMGLPTGVALLLALITMMALPLAHVMNLPSSKRQFAAVSIIVPCFALIWAVWLNLATDASLSRGVELEEELLTKIRASL